MGDRTENIQRRFFTTEQNAVQIVSNAAWSNAGLRGAAALLLHDRLAFGNCSLTLVPFPPRNLKRGCHGDCCLVGTQTWFGEGVDRSVFGDEHFSFLMCVLCFVLFLFSPGPDFRSLILCGVPSLHMYHLSHYTTKVCAFFLSFQHELV
ncbi:hypothetical protein NPIL_422571 [Nephila pilipes]|uniref:Uncharacterized protein n=1 Tax=Nephila pilipes TaxID=299642 RepID=A0A8X6QPU5_NEPPI|nr:hypothetical protein NPIL_422571 [Nephila pilipes]